MQKKTTKIILAVVAVICAIAVAVTTIILLSQGSGKKYEKHLELAEQRFL